MLLRAVALGLTLLPAAWAGERVEQREFVVGTAPKLRLETYRGAIRVTAGGAGRIRIEVHETMESSDPNTVAEAYRRLHLEWGNPPNGVALLARNPADTRARFVWEEKYKLALEYVVTVPSDAVLDLTTHDGGVTVGDLSGSVTAHARRGVVYLKHIGGDIDATDEEGAIVVSHGGGNVRVVDRVGDIRVGGVSGRLDARNVNGDIEVQRVGRAAVVRATAGDVTLELGGEVPAGIYVSTNGGGIVMRISPDARCTLHASSVWGKVRSHVPIAITRGANETGTLEGNCNGGGPVVTLHADGGHIDLRPAPL